MPFPQELVGKPPAIWVRPGNRKTAVCLPWGGYPSANADYLKSLHLRVTKGFGPTWLITRGRTDEVRSILHQRYGKLLVIIDTANQRICGSQCQGANPENALQCQCSCGGENHGGGSGWKPVGDLLIETDYTRRYWFL